MSKVDFSAGNSRDAEPEPGSRFAGINRKRCSCNSNLFEGHDGPCTGLGRKEWQERRAQSLGRDDLVPHSAPEAMVSRASVVADMRKTEDRWAAREAELRGELEFYQRELRRRDPRLVEAHERTGLNAERNTTTNRSKP